MLQKRYNVQIPKPSRNDCKNNDVMVNKLTYYKYKVSKSCVQKSQMGYSRKKSKEKKGGGRLRTYNFQQLLLAKYLLAINH